MTARAVSSVIRLYRALSATRPPTCRYWPTCSAYALDAVDSYGARHGMVMALKRVVRCHPWGGHGVDPVPMPLGTQSSRSSATQVGR